MIFIVVKFTARPEVSDQWLSIVDEFTKATRNEPGNIFFEWSRSVDNPDEYVLVEAFEDGDAGSAHVNSDHFKKAMAELPYAVAKKPDIVNVEVPGSGWSEMAEITPAQ